MEDSIQHSGFNGSGDENLLRGESGKGVVSLDNDDEFKLTSTNTYQSTDARDRHLIIKSLNQTIANLEAMSTTEYNDLTKKFTNPKYSFTMGEKGTGSSANGEYFIKLFLFTM